MLDLTDLHDAILESVTIEIDAATVMLVLAPVQFDGAPDRVTLIARGWKTFSCPKKEPWGSASEWYVNEARGPSIIESGLERVELEMQSGDVIEIEAASMERLDERREIQNAGKQALAADGGRCDSEPPRLKRRR